MQSIWLLMAICVLVVPQSSCSVHTPHENFIVIMQSHMGKALGDRSLYGWMQPARLIGHKDLPNGGIEYAYRFRGDCRYYYEIDSQSQKIVGWRFEGSERDCIINP